MPGFNNSRTGFIQLVEVVI